MTAAELPPSDEDDDEPLVVPAAMHDSPPDSPTAGRDRAGLAEEAELSPMSLVGSYFHRVENAEIVWEGLVVGEVQPGMYLCQITGGLEGADKARVQVVVALTNMTASDVGYEWRFYDTVEARTLAYAEYLVALGRHDG